MAIVTSIIESKGTFKNDQGREVEFDNYCFYMMSGERLNSVETLIAGEGKPAMVKIKKDEFMEVYKDDPKLLYGQNVRFLKENDKLAKVEIIQKKA